jgi:hypothetical protein
LSEEKEEVNIDPYASYFGLGGANDFPEEDEVVDEI